MTAALANPWNDQFGAAAILAGAEVDFAGTLHEATLESSEPVPDFPPLLPGTGSVWWSWTAPATGFAAVTVEEFAPANFPAPTLLAVFAGETLEEARNAQARVGQVLAEPNHYLGFKTRAGATYMISLWGPNSFDATNRFHLSFRDAPILLEQPRAQTAHAGSAVRLQFKAPRYDGDRKGEPVEAQWQFKGRNLAGETGRNLVIPNVSGARAGEYRVVLTEMNADGKDVSTFSESTVLTVEEVTVPPRIEFRRLPGANRFFMEIAGEASHYYSIRFSYNLIQWSFVDFPGFGSGTPHGLVDTSQPGWPVSDRALFFAAESQGSFRDGCVANLGIVDYVKQTWAIEFLRPSGSATDIFAFNQYFSQDFWPSCPEGGIHTVGAVGTLPVCSIAGHTL